MNKFILIIHQELTPLTLNIIKLRYSNKKTSYLRKERFPNSYFVSENPGLILNGRVKDFWQRRNIVPKYSYTNKIFSLKEKD